MRIRSSLREQVAVARYLARWLLMLTPVAFVVGTASAAFLWSLKWATETRWEHGWLLFLLPAAGLLSAAAYHRFGRAVEGGNNLIVDEIHTPGGGIPPRITPLIFGTTVLAHLFGASVGREGTAVQMGGGIASAFDRVFRVGPEDLRTLLMAGVAAGFGAVFGTPLAGAVFAMEVLAVGRMEYGALIPVLYAALAADFTAAAWDAHHTAYHVSIVARDGSLPFSALLMGKVALGGVAFGLAALFFTELTHGLGQVFRRSIKNPLFRPVVGGALTIALVYLLGTRDYLGLGVTSPEAGATTIVSSFERGGADPFSWWWKIAFTALALGSGFKGGEVTPLFFIGATLGNRVAALLDGPADLFAGMGFVAVFGAAANTPLACTIMGIELFGGNAAPYLALACFVAYLVSGHRGIYLSQRIGTPKTGDLSPAIGTTLREVRDGGRAGSAASGAAGNGESTDAPATERPAKAD
ncbi:MAG: voltage-gated chloride channel family protein [Dehalococcoidia bacterium]